MCMNKPTTAAPTTAAADLANFDRHIATVNAQLQLDHLADLDAGDLDAGYEPTMSETIDRLESFARIIGA